MTDINLNSTYCVRAESGIGETVYHNICNNTSQTVPWGDADWFGFYTLVGFGGVILLLFLVMLGMLVRMMFDY